MAERYKKDNNLCIYNKDKDEINNILIPKYLNSGMKGNFSYSKAVVLDGKKARTSVSLINLGFSPKNIFVPNQCAETCEEIKEKNVTVSNETLDDFVENSNDTYRLVYADYCGSYSQV